MQTWIVSFSFFYGILTVVIKESGVVSYFYMENFSGARKKRLTINLGIKFWQQIVATIIKVSFTLETKGAEMLEDKKQKTTK